MSGAADEQGHGAAVLAADMNLTLENEDHVGDGGALFKEHIAGVGDVLLPWRASQRRSSRGRPWSGPMRSRASAISSAGVGEAGVVTAGESIRGPPGVQFQDSRLCANLELRVMGLSEGKLPRRKRSCSDHAGMRFRYGRVPLKSMRRRREDGCVLDRWFRLGGMGNPAHSSRIGLSAGGKSVGSLAIKQDQARREEGRRL